MLIDVGELFLKGLQQSPDALGCTGRRSLKALVFRTDHGDDLPTTGNEIGQRFGVGVGKRPQVWSGGFCKASDDSRIDWSVLARLPSARAKARTWAGLATTTGSVAAARAATTTVSKPPVASMAIRSCRVRCLLHSQREQTVVVTGHMESSHRGRSHRDVQAVSGDIDTDVESVHPIPSSRKRASLSAAQATVRVRWNGGRGPCSPMGLASLRGIGLPSATATGMTPDRGRAKLQGAVTSKRLLDRGNFRDSLRETEAVRRAGSVDRRDVALDQYDEEHQRYLKVTAQRRDA